MWHSKRGLGGGQASRHRCCIRGDCRKGQGGSCGQVEGERAASAPLPGGVGSPPLALENARLLAKQRLVIPASQCEEIGHPCRQWGGIGPLKSSLASALHLPLGHMIRAFSEVSFSRVALARGRCVWGRWDPRRLSTDNEEVGSRSFLRHAHLGRRVPSGVGGMYQCLIFVRPLSLEGGGSLCASQQNTQKVRGRRPVVFPGWVSAEKRLGSRAYSLVPKTSSWRTPRLKHR